MSVVKNVDNSMLMHRRDSQPGGIGEQCVHILFLLGVEHVLELAHHLG